MGSMFILVFAVLWLVAIVHLALVIASAWTLCKGRKDK